MKKYLFGLINLIIFAMGKKEDKEKTEREVLSKYYLDMSKTTFATIVLTNLTAVVGLTDFTFKSVLVFVVGIVATGAFAYVGYKFLKR